MVLPWISQKPDDAAEALGVFAKIDQVLGVVSQTGEAEAGGDAAEEEIAELCHGIDAARVAKDYDRADALRQQLVDAGYEVRTSPEGTVAQRRLA